MSGAQLTPRGSRDRWTVEGAHRLKQAAGPMLVAVPTARSQITPGLRIKIDKQQRGHYLSLICR